VIEDTIEVAAQPVGIDRRKVQRRALITSSENGSRRSGRSSATDFPGARNRKPLTSDSPVDHVTAMVAQFTDRDFGHTPQPTNA
jgi:hypothetical protein